MSSKLSAKRIADFANQFRITDPKKFRIKDTDPGDTKGFKSKEMAKEMLQGGVNLLSDLQEKLYAQNRWAVLLIFQAMDAAGKDGTIKHVLSGVNPQGCEVFSFKSPTSTDLNHDYLWRCMQCLPERGRIGIFNRSYYEETLAVRVHPEFLAGQKVPKKLLGKKVWEERFEDINAFERYLSRNGIIVRKFFLNLSKDEQRRRFLSRLEESEKHWKFSPADAKERGFWDEYQTAYEETIRHTSTKYSPWYVVPADNKWFTRVVVAAAVVEAMQSLDLEFPKVNDAMHKDLESARKALLAEKHK
ncbi:MAG: polyphosphate kinase 2 family protein [Verrucomicrobiota bacterium]